MKNRSRLLFIRITKKRQARNKLRLIIRKVKIAISILKNHRRDKRWLKSFFYLSELYSGGIDE
jgi:hypothetical protein